MSTPENSENTIASSVKNYRFPHNAPSVNIQQLLDLMASLRAPDGCPWDRKQTFASLVPYLQEESAEYIDAVRSRDPQAMREELGDVLLQVVFHAQIGREKGLFDLQDVIDTLVHKLWTRHPHVFGDEDKVTDASAVEDVWARQKAKEREAKGAPDIDNPLAKVPKSLPTLVRAEAIGDAAAKIGFDFESAEDALRKVEEELEEVREAMTNGDRVHTEEEIGDLLCSVVNLARKSDICPDRALAQCNQKFTRRMEYVLQKMQEQNLVPSAEHMDIMEEFWREARHKRVEDPESTREE